MENHSAVVVDGSRARIFLLKHGGTVVEPTVRLEEAEDLVNPVHRLKDSQVYSETTSGVRAESGPRTPGGQRGPTRTFDDHREQHDAEFERRFARLVAEKLLELAASENLTHVVLAAEPRMLGYLRKELPKNTTFRTDEVRKDLTHLSETELHDHLANEGLLPKRRDRLGGQRAV